MSHLLHLIMTPSIFFKLIGGCSFVHPFTNSKFQEPHMVSLDCVCYRKFKKKKKRNLGFPFLF